MYTPYYKRGAGLLIKTHLGILKSVAEGRNRVFPEWRMSHIRNFEGRGILLIRNPYTAVISHWNHRFADFNLFGLSKALIIFGVLDSLDGLSQFVVCIDDGIRWCDCRLSDIFVFEEHRVCETFCSCLLAKNHMCPVMLF